VYVNFKRNYWWVLYLQRMIGAYIASMTAFAVLSARQSLSFIPWLLPAAIFVLNQIRWSRKVKARKLAS
jgi:hypothetical protein